MVVPDVWAPADHTIHLPGPHTMANLDASRDWDRLLNRCRQSDAEAWNRLVDSTQSLVYSIPRRYGLGADDAADVFQATYQALFKNLDRMQSGRALPKWLAVTAARESLRIKRIQSRTVGAEDLGLSLDEIVAQEETTAEGDAVAAESADDVRRAVASLQERCRELLTALYLAEETPYAEIAERLGMPIGAIGPTRARCLDKLRKILEQDGFFE